MNENKNRATFQSRLGFILVSAGCAIGLGNVWKFPYICGQNGGGAFLFLYLICLVLLGLPILICEFAIGRGSNRSLSQAFNRLEKPGSRYHCTKYTSIAGNYLLMMFYTMVTGWMLYYAFKYATGSLDASSTATTAEAFKDMQASPWLMLIFSAIVIILCIGVCALGLQNGIEKVTKFMMILLMALMVVLAVNSIRLKGASEGLKFFLVPDFDVFKEKGFTSVLFAAMTQAFFTLSIGIGTMEIFGSYLKKDRTLVGESVNVIVLDTAVPAVFGFNLLKNIQPMGAGSTIMDLEDFLVSSNLLPLGSLVGVLFCVRKNGWGWENFIKEANTGKGKHIPDGLRSYMSYVVPALICFIYLKGYYDTFSNRSLPVLIGWMCFAVILLVLIFWATFSKSKKNLENPIDK